MADGSFTTEDCDAIDAACQESFDCFAQRAFEIIEPGTAYEWNWHIGCFPYEEQILTEHGYLPIGQIVESEYCGNVLSFNHITNKTEWKKITSRFINCGRQLYDLVTSEGDLITLTDNHPVWSNGKYKEAQSLQNGDGLLRTLQQAVPKNTMEENKVLRNSLLWTSQSEGKRHRLSNLSGKEVLYSQNMQILQRDTLQKRQRTPMRKLWQDSLHESVRHESIITEAWGVLQYEMFGGACNWKKQRSVYRWRTQIGILQKCIQSGAKKSLIKRWSQMLSLWRNPDQTVRGASYRQEHTKQRNVEPCEPMQNVSQPSKGKSRRSIETSECFVKSITKNARICDKVYNIEVADNNNYFAGGILVHNCISEHLEASFRGELPWLIINVSPRTLKSVLVAQLYPAWVLGKEPHHQFIGASYAHSLAERNVMRSRQIISDGWYQSCFPNTRISNDQNQKDYFTTTKAGQYKGTGIGGTITGFGCDTLLIDDPINPREGSSETIRNNTNNEIRSTLFSRFNNRAVARFIMIMQRVHEDDPTGNIMRDGRCHLLKLPAEAKSPVKVLLDKRKWEMQEGDYLTPRLGKAELDELRTDLGEYGFLGQYMQEPVPVGGGEFKSEWVQYYQAGGVRPKTMNIVILVDPSGGEELNRKKKKSSDWTAMMVVGLAPDRNYYLLDMVRDRLNPTERVDTLFMLHKKWNDLGGKPPKVGYEKYSMQTDTFYIKEKQRNDGYNFPLIILGGQMEKTDRIRRLIPDMQLGRWYFPANLMYCDSEGRTFDLVKELVSSELASFPKARFDDCSDALSRIYEEDLMLSFPAMKQSETQKVIAMNAQRESESWLDY